MARRTIFKSTLLTILLVSLSSAATSQPAASWSFEGAKGADAVHGYSKFVPGVSGTALRFDGQTTSVVRSRSRPVISERVAAMRDLAATGAGGRPLGHPGLCTSR